MTVGFDGCWLLVDGKSNGTPITQIERIYSDKKSRNTKHLPLSPFSFILYPLTFTLYPLSFS